MAGNKQNSLVAWSSSSSPQEGGHGAEVKSWTTLAEVTQSEPRAHIKLRLLSSQVIESRTLALARSLTQQLQTTCLVLVSSLHGLPSHVQQEALSLSRSASHIYVSFSKAKVLGDLPDNVLTGCKVQLGKMKDSLDNVMDYLVNNTPLNWLVGPFYPRIGPQQTPATASPADCSSYSSTQPISEEPMEVEMESLNSQQRQ